MNLYAKDLGDRDVLTALAETPERLRQIVGRLTDDELDRAYGPAKWTARQIIDHLAQTEMVYGMRLRMALSTIDYVVQPFDQDKFMSREPRHDSREAFETFYTLRKYNLPLYRSLTKEERVIPFLHPERGQMTVWELPATLAGHDLHHLQHLEQIAGVNAGAGG